MPKKKKGPVLFKIHNTVRDVQTRVVRKMAPTRHCRVLLLGGGLIRVVRKRPAIVAPSIIKRLLPELMALEKAGRVKVTDMAGRRMDLETGQLAELPPAPKPPTKVLDSAANDPAFEHGVGQDMPPMLGNEAEQADVEPPTVLERDFPEGKDEEPPHAPPEDVVPGPLPEGTPEDVVPEEPTPEVAPEVVVAPEVTPEVADTEPAPELKAETPEPDTAVEVPALVQEEKAGRRRKRNKKG